MAEQREAVQGVFTPDMFECLINFEDVAEKGKLTVTYGDEFQDMVVRFRLEKSQVCRNIVLGKPLPSNRVSKVIEGSHPVDK